MKWESYFYLRHLFLYSSTYLYFEWPVLVVSPVSVLTECRKTAGRGRSAESET